MARIDGEVDNKEYEAIANAFVRFASGTQK